MEDSRLGEDLTGRAPVRRCSWAESDPLMRAYHDDVGERKPPYL